MSSCSLEGFSGNIKLGNTIPVPGQPYLVKHGPVLQAKPIPGYPALHKEKETLLRAATDFSRSAVSLHWAAQGRSTI